MKLTPLLAGLLAITVPAQTHARLVVHRHVTKLDHALAIAIGAQPSAKTVEFLVDVTPYTYRAAPQIAAALRVLDSTKQQVRSWRIARIGRPLGAAVRRPSDLVAQLGRVFGKETQTVNTFEALSKTLRGISSTKGAIVYLADWHVEDDFRLERMIKRLRAKGRAFTTIGTEGCFGRAWNDGFFPPHRRSRNLYDHGVGRNPFDNNDKKAPWHGGDTAWPHLPFYWHGAHWSTRFAMKLRPPPKIGRYGKPQHGADALNGPEDLRERMRKVDEKATEVYHFPVPSGFGPYGLMRLAAETGGKYILWSWNPGGRSDLCYDYAQIDRYAPDLRSRKAIRRNIRRQPLGAAILNAWHAVGNNTISTSQQTPAIGTDWKPRPVEELNGRGFTSTSWGAKPEWKQFLKQAPKTMAALDRALGILERAIQRTGVATDPVTRRYLVDAELWYQTLLVHRFTIGEAFVEAQKVPEKTAWDKLPFHPNLHAKRFIGSHKNSERHEVRVYEVALHNPKLGARVLASRRKFLDRYAMTPQAELVARNSVSTMRLHWNTYATGQPSKSSPAESKGKKANPITPRSRGRAGPKTGGR